MALSVLRRGLGPVRGLSRQLVAPVCVLRPQVATIVSKNFRDKDYKRPPAFPYETNSYGFIEALFDKTTYRFDENSKIIVVDGPVAAGKSKFAKQVADDLDMQYIPEANMDMQYINSYGYDLRQLDAQLPDSCKSFDEKNYCQNPSHRLATAFQFNLFRIRLEQYLKALSHVLNTGQGVVMDRSIYSDYVFVETMAHFGYMSKAAQNLYYQVKKATVSELMRPHLVIYLDMPVSDVLQSIKKRNLPHEKNSPICTEEYLSYMDHVYKLRYLKEISTHAQLLIYDWSDEGEPEVVVEDIERVNFEFDKHNPKMVDWRLADEWEWCQQRMLYSKKKDWFFNWMNVPTGLQVPEVVIPAEDVKIRDEVYDSAPGNRYAEGYNADMGDQFLAFKMKPVRVQ